MDTILHAEISYRRTGFVGLNIHIFTEECINTLDALHQSLVLEDFLFTGKAQTLKKHYGIVLGIMIKLRVKVTEQVACLIVPHPPHVVGNLIQTFQLLRKGRLYSQFLPLRSICVICFDFHNLLC